MTQQFLQAVYSRRPAPKEYDATWINLELARINKAIANIPRNTDGSTASMRTQTVSVDRLEASSADIGPPVASSLNLVEYSQQMDSGSWSFFPGTVVIGNTIQAPDGTLTGDTINDPVIGGGGIQSSPWSPLTSTQVTMSVHIKRLTTTNQTNFGIVDLTTNTGVAEAACLWGSGATANDITGMSNAGGGSTGYTWTQVATGWWRCSGKPTATLDPTHKYALFIYARNSGNTGSIYVWGAQVNAGNLIVYIETRALGTALSVRGLTSLGATTITGALTITGTVVNPLVVPQLTISDDTNGSVTIGRLSAIIPWSYLAFSAASSGIRIINLANFTPNLFEFSAAGHLGINSQASSATTALAIPAGTTGVSPLRFAPGVAPTSRVTGDVWGDSAGLYYHAGTTTVGPFVDSGSVFLLMGA